MHFLCATFVSETLLTSQPPVAAVRCSYWGALGTGQIFRACWGLGIARNAVSGNFPVLGAASAETPNDRRCSVFGLFTEGRLPLR